MNILFVIRDLPYPMDAGYRIRNFCLIKSLARENKVFLAVMSDKGGDRNALRELDKCCVGIKAFPARAESKSIILKTRLMSLFSPLPYSIKRRYVKEFAEQTKKLAGIIKADLVVCDSIYQSIHVPFSKNYTSILYEHNIESMIFYRYFKTQKNWLKRIFTFIEYVKMGKYQKKIWKKFDLCVVASENDKNIIADYIDSEKISVVPNGINVTYYLDISQDDSYRNLILYTGQIGWYPNEDALVYFANEIYPLIKIEIPTVKFQIIGKNPSKRIINLAKEDNLIEVTGFVKDIKPYLAKASVYIVPLRIGSGTRLKILEAMAAGKAVVSTSIGCEGLDVHHNKNILIADEPEDFANSVITLFRDDKLRKRIGEEGRKLIREKYDWKIIYRCIDKSMEKISGHK